MIFIFSCNENINIHSNKLETALKASKTNRSELEKVLQHYSNNPKDSLKLKAAEFLISNMTYHRSLCGDYIDRHIKIVDSLYHDIPLYARCFIYTIPSLIDSLKPFVKTELDIEKITADFLIKNIDYSYNIWQNSIYEPRISFDDFCEYILPYKFGNEPLILWKDSIVLANKRCRDFNTYELNMSEIDPVYYTNHPISMNYKLLPDSNLNTYVNKNEDAVSIKLALYRYNGFPKAIDFIPFTDIKNYKNGFWLTTICEKYINSNFTSLNKIFSAKVFRKTYSINQTPDDKDNFIPIFIRNPYIKDVTDIYQNTSIVEYDFGNVPANVKYAYLAVFYDGDWHELSWSKLNNGKASFKNMGHDMMYMPIYYNGTERVYANKPILVNRSGNICDIDIIDNETQNITISRISTYSIQGESEASAIIGSKIAACNDTLSMRLDTLAKITHSKYMQFDTTNINSDKKYKYWFLFVPRYSMLSELQFFDKKGNMLSGENIRINGKLTKSEFIDNIFDNNILTYSPITLGVGIAFDKPVSVSYIKYITKNDGNSIIPNNQYELFYFSGGKWVSLGRKIANEYDLEFKNIPVGALFWLHNYSEKCIERPFTIINGKIKFW